MMMTKKVSKQNAPTGNRTRSPCMASRDFTIKPSVRLSMRNGCFLKMVQNGAVLLPIVLVLYSQFISATCVSIMSGSEIGDALVTSGLISGEKEKFGPTEYPVKYVPKILIYQAASQLSSVCNGEKLDNQTCDQPASEETEVEPATSADIDVKSSRGRFYASFMCVDLSGFTALLKDHSSAPEELIKAFRQFFKELVETISLSDRDAVNTDTHTTSAGDARTKAFGAFGAAYASALSRGFDTAAAAHFANVAYDAAYAACIQDIADNSLPPPPNYEGGDIVKFTGDGLQVIWPCHVYSDPESKDSIRASALERAMMRAVKNAAECGRTLLQKFERPIKIGEQDKVLNIRIGISCGEMLGIDCVEHDGQKTNSKGRFKRAEFFLLGQPLVDGNTAESLGKQLHGNNRLIICSSAMRYLSMEQYHPIANNKGFYIGTLDFHEDGHKKEADEMNEECSSKRNHLWDQNIDKNISESFKNLIFLHSHESVQEQADKENKRKIKISRNHMSINSLAAINEQNSLPPVVPTNKSGINSDPFSSLGQVFSVPLRAETSSETAHNIVQRRNSKTAALWILNPEKLCVESSEIDAASNLDENFDLQRLNQSSHNVQGQEHYGGYIGHVVTLFISLSVHDNELFVDKAAVRQFDHYGMVSTLSNQELYHDETLTRKYTKYLSTICDVIHNHDGHLRQFINDDKGVVAICNFGIKKLSQSRSTSTTSSVAGGSTAPSSPFRTALTPKPVGGRESDAKQDLPSSLNDNSSASVEHGNNVEAIDDKVRSLIENSKIVSNAILSAWDIRKEFEELGVVTKIGLSLGSAFYGFLGSDKRREFVVMGGSVNKSARLMGKANPGEILCDWSCFQDIVMDGDDLSEEKIKEFFPLLFYYKHNSINNRIEIKQSEYGNHKTETFPFRAKSFFDIKGYENKEIKAAIISSK